MPRDRCRLAIVDFDGTLINSRSAHFQAYVEALEQYKIDPNLIPLDWFGRSTLSVMSQILEEGGFTHIDLNGLIKFKQLKARFLTSRMSACPKILEELRSFDVKWIWSSSSCQSINACIAYNGLENFFSRIITHENYDFAKPDFVGLSNLLSILGFLVKDATLFDDIHDVVLAASVKGFKVRYVTYD